VPQPKVVITDMVTDELAPEREALGDGIRLEALGARCEEDLAGRVEDADAIIVYQLPVSRGTIERLARCRVVVRGGVGFDKVDRAFARERGIAVANVPDYCTEEVADSALGLVLALTRGLAFANSRLRSREDPWSFSVAAPLRRLRGRALGIVGLGRIGTATALRAKALGMTVAYYDPYKPLGFDKALDLRRAATLEELARESWVLSLHCPLTPETRHMIDASVLSLLPAGGYLVNTARGAVVDGAAALDAVSSGHLAGVGLDVLEREPPPDDDPLVRAWRDASHPAHARVVLTPHCAFYSEESRRECRTKAALACLAALAGQPIPNVVN
jgi:D-3-phosphoglycerate dehydrogenase/C-terminal binding protein